ncbi:hypothetical protein DL96DRAFT_1708248 [Flagelloscypha sp. PMI_526]|nr:hypothetical protein DL96DRAFT_1708248 [Flagelloscypha sp. PMI_526]
MASLTFLTIPLDIRESVLELALFTPYNPYPILSLAEGTRQSPIQRPSFGNHSFFKGHYWHYAPCHLSYELGECFSAHNPSLILSLVNRQLKDEVAALIHRFEDNPEYHRYTLDILFVNEQNFWPTWTSFPPRPIRKSDGPVVIPRVDVTFRIAGGKKPGRSIFIHGNAVPPPIEFCVYHILERFLRAGPFLEKPNESKADINYNIAVLNIDFTAILAEGEEFYGKEDELNWQEENERSYWSEPATEAPVAAEIIQPQWLASSITSSLSSLSRMSYHTAEFGAMLYERVRDIHITVEGVEDESLWLDELLQELNPTGSGDTFGKLSREKRLPYFNKWKKEVQERRSRRHRSQALRIL